MPDSRKTENRQVAKTDHDEASDDISRSNGPASEGATVAGSQLEVAIAASTGTPTMLQRFGIAAGADDRVPVQKQIVSVTIDKPSRTTWWKSPSSR